MDEEEIDFGEDDIDFVDDVDDEDDDYDGVQSDVSFIHLKMYYMTWTYIYVIFILGKRRF